MSALADKAPEDRKAYWAFVRSRADEIAKRTMTDAQAWHSENDYPRGDGDGSIRRMHNEWMEAELACARVVPADLGASVV